VSNFRWEAGPLAPRAGAASPDGFQSSEGPSLRICGGGDQPLSADDVPELRTRMNLIARRRPGIYTGARDSHYDAVGARGQRLFRRGPGRPAARLALTPSPSGPGHAAACRGLLRRWSRRPTQPPCLSRTGLSSFSLFSLLLQPLLSSHDRTEARQRSGRTDAEGLQARPAIRPDRDR